MEPISFRKRCGAVAAGLLLRSLLGSLLASLLASLLLFLPACSTVQTRIKEKPAAYAALSDRDRQIVEHHEIREGFSKDAVYIAWARPDHMARGTDHGRQVETWTWFGYYDRPAGYYYDPFYYGWGGFGPIWYPVYETVAYPYKVVTFENGRVSAWRAPMR